MNEIIIAPTNSNEKKHVEVIVYFYLFKNGLPVQSIKDAYNINIVIQEHIFIKRLTEEAFTDEILNRTILLPTNAFEDITPYAVITVDQDDSSDTLDLLLKEFINRFNKGYSEERSRTLDFSINAPFEFKNYNFSPELIENIMERFTDIRFDFGNMNNAIKLPVKNFNNSSITIRNAKLIVEQMEFHGSKLVDFDTITLYPLSNDFSYYMSLSSNSTIRIRNIQLNNIVYLRCNIKTRDRSEYDNSSISLYETTIISDEITIPKEIKQSLIKIGGPKKVLIDTVNVYGDLPGFRVLDISVCEEFEVTNYNHNRESLSATQDIVISDFFTGTFLNCNIVGPSEKQQEPSMYFVLCNNMRNEAKLIFNNININYYGLIIVINSIFNTLKCINSTIKNVLTAIDFKGSTIQHLTLKDCNLEKVNSFECNVSDQNYINSKFNITTDIELNFREKLKISESSFESSTLITKARENSKINMSDTKITSKELIELKCIRPEDSQQTEVFTLKNTILSAQKLLVDNVLKINCTNLVLEKIKNTTFSNTHLIFSSLKFDYMNIIGNINFINSIFTGSTIEFTNTPSKFETNISGTSGKLTYIYNNPDTFSASHVLNLDNSQIDLIINEVVGNINIPILSKDSKGSKVVSSVQVAMIPDIMSKDKLLFKKAKTITEKDSESILYGTFI